MDSTAAATLRGTSSAQEGTFSTHKGASVGPYKLMQKLGQGDFGEVWMAEQREPVKRRVALKIIKLGMDTWQVVAGWSIEVLRAPGWSEINR